MTDLLARLQAVRRAGDGWTARCPAHQDQENSLSVHHREGKWLLKCHAGCDWQDILKAIGVQAAELFDQEPGGRGESYPRINCATVQPSGLNLEQYAAAKKLPVEFLKTCGLSQFTYEGANA